MSSAMTAKTEEKTTMNELTTVRGVVIVPSMKIVTAESAADKPKALLALQNSDNILRETGSLVILITLSLISLEE